VKLDSSVSSTNLVTGQSGNLVAKTTYTPFGLPYQLEGNLNTDKTYTGQRDDGIGLLDYNARFYSPYTAVMWVSAVIDITK